MATHESKIIEVPYKTSRRGLLSFLGASAIGGPALVNAFNLPEVNSGIIVVEENVPERKWRTKLNAMHKSSLEFAMDVQPGALYDCVKLEPGVALKQHETFFIDVGFTSGKTYMETNMARPQSLCAPESFKIDRISAHITSLNDDTRRLCEEYVLELWIGQKNYYRGPLPLVTNILHSPLKKEHAAIFEDGLLIQNQMHFNANLLGQPFIPKERSKIFLYLEGLHARAVQ